ncbi:uncharacterized protein METZ01_LOCUS116846 [marine metagenome]|uniref:Uncharacterized protein n=1 Tax=marine metagenome TaxID=408172 RepID=A0A381XHI2_9ZZZZ
MFSPRAVSWVESSDKSQFPSRFNVSAPLSPLEKKSILADLSTIVVITTVVPTIMTKPKKITI